MHASVVIPLRNEEPNVLPLHEELSPVLVALGSPYELLFVDDGSDDGTFEKLGHLQARDPHVRVIRFQRNFGQTAAFAAGFANARGRFIITSDGDLQNDPADIPRMLALSEEGYDIVCGWRRERHDPFLTRHLPSIVANWLIGTITGIRLHDNGCSLKVFRAEVVKPLNLRPGMHRYLPALASQLGSRITEVVVHHRPRRHGRSKYGLSRTFRVVVDLVRMRTLMREALEPARAAEPLYEIREVREVTTS
ncbi:MAG TPA: glycosyltransferase family 2 protein [Vicinamibacterales bacterium]|jgi:glycosyltransferase involved in cell wall biosynthesis|nr:glycosyltransferase family 2 protein [Vicinamibacterales bacterium]